MEWREVVEHPSLQDLPFKIETNQWGEIVMTPATATHGLYQALINEYFAGMKDKGGRSIIECPIETSEGTKVADFAWGSGAFFKRHGFRVTSFTESPEIVVEVKSPSNSLNRMEGKKQLYFAAGAKEVWFCDEEGDMHFFSPGGKLKRSELFTEFPERINIDIV
ncbi:MAG: Uma2 family endonuclease [Syntrophobacteraceae bacterium]|nr:Uma2 family endonuclease [Syntrophobacteraceae bacterium]